MSKKKVVAGAGTVIHEEPAPLSKIPSKLPQPSEVADAFSRVVSEIEVLAGEDVGAPKLDIPTAVARALGAEPNLMSLRDRIVAELPSHPIGKLDNLRVYALAALHAHLATLPRAPDSEGKVTKLLEEGTPLREALLIAAEALAHAGLMDATHVAAIRAGQGNIDKANDLIALSAYFQQEWAKVANRTAVTEVQVERAGAIGGDLLVELGIRSVGSVVTSSSLTPAEQKARAAFLFVAAYEQCRRAVQYLRYDEGDADEFAPSLFTGRRKPNGSAEVGKPKGDAGVAALVAGAESPAKDNG